jgi:hypothetical protein
MVEMEVEGQVDGLGELVQRLARLDLNVAIDGRLACKRGREK